jgi:Transposase IS116/IS110/IS902 family
VFPSAGHLASWAGRCPGNNVTGGKRRSGRTRQGNRWLGELLIECAWAAARSRDSYLSAQFWRLARRIGKRRPPSPSATRSWSLPGTCWPMTVTMPTCAVTSLPAATLTVPGNARSLNSRPSATASPLNPSLHDGGFSFQDALFVTFGLGRQRPCPVLRHVGTQLGALSRLGPIAGRQETGGHG